ncbi:hypothetical protein SAMD00019534_050300, partial [Acytostelium subglobosum LB1]|uniref:hypothetical protein n=1 Tax=Acytostelium subglobosum LB1 TaxID=1410327 RepID=UPI000644DE43
DIIILDNNNNNIKMDSEDLNNNVFLNTIKLKHPKIFNTIESNCYMLCIPHSMSLYGFKITQKTIGME